MVLQTHLTIVIGIQRRSEKITLINFLPDIKTWLRKKCDQKPTPPSMGLVIQQEVLVGEQSTPGGEAECPQDDSTTRYKHSTPQHDDEHRGLPKG